MVLLVSDRPTATLRVIAEMSGMRLQRVYELFRLPIAPPPAAHVACVPVYEIARAMAYVAAGSPQHRPHASDDASGDAPGNGYNDVSPDAKDS